MIVDNTLYFVEVAGDELQYQNMYRRLYWMITMVEKWLDIFQVPISVEPAVVVAYDALEFSRNCCMISFFLGFSGPTGIP